MTRRMRFLAAVLVASSALMSAPADAQDVTVGYQFQQFRKTSEENYPLGFGVDASVPLAHRLSILGQIDASRKAQGGREDDGLYELTTTIATYAAGLRWTVQSADSTIFVQALGGAMRISLGCKVDGVDVCHDSGFDLAESHGLVGVGGGLLFPIAKRVGGVAQVDYRRVFWRNEGTNSLRFLAGLRFRFR